MPTKPKRRIMVAFKLNEISAVDTPAQEGARMVLMKRHEDVEKGYSDLVDVFTSSEDGHQHGIRVREGYDGECARIEVSYATGEDSESHDHQVMRGPDGSLVLTENAGHTHTLNADAVQQALLTMMIGKVQETPAVPGGDADDVGNQSTEESMTEKTAADHAAELQKRDATIANLQLVIDLSPEHRAHYDSLPLAKREDFLTSTDAAKDAAIEAAKAANPVVYTAADGTVYRKSDDSRLVKMAEERDNDRKEAAAMRLETENVRFEKQADEILGLLPGESAEKVALIRAVAKIDDEPTRGAIHKLLAAANKICTLALTTVGKAAPVAVDKASAEAVLNAEIQKLRAADPTLDEGRATAKLMDTAAGQALYKAYRDERRSKQANGH